MTSCIVGKKIRAMGPGPLELFPFVVLAILMAMAGGISEHMLTSWSSCKWEKPLFSHGGSHVVEISVCKWEKPLFSHGGSHHDINITVCKWEKPLYPMVAHM